MNKSDILKELSGLKSSTEKGRRFLDYCVSSLYPEDPDLTIFDGSGDGGIDAYKITNGVSYGLTVRDEFLIIQSKYGESLSGPDTIRAEIAKIEELFEDEEYSGRALDVYNELRRFVNSKGRVNSAVVKIVFLTSDPLTESEKETLIKSSKRLERTLGVDVVCENIDLECIFSDRVDSGVYNLNSLGLLPIDSRTLIATVPIEEIYDLYVESSKRTGNDKVLFSRNLRQFVGDTKVNKEIKQTLTLNPEEFGKRNNGLKVISNKVSYDINTGKFILDSPSIINGCQTTNVIHNYCSELIKLDGKTRESIKTGAWVLVTIIDVGDMSIEEINKITEASNKQNRIKSVELSNALSPVADEVRTMLDKNYNIKVDVRKCQTEIEEALRKEKTKSKALQLSELTNMYISCVMGKQDTALHQKAQSAFTGTHGSIALDQFLKFPYLGELSYYLTQTRYRAVSITRKYAGERGITPIVIVSTIHYQLVLSLYDKYKKDKKAIEALAAAMTNEDDRYKTVTEDFANFYKAVVSDSALNDELLDMSGKIFKEYTCVSCRDDMLFADFPSTKKEYKNTLNRVCLRSAVVLKKTVNAAAWGIDKRFEKNIKDIIKGL